METLTPSPFEMSNFYFLRSTFTNAAHALLFPVCVPDSSIVFRCNRKFFLQRSLWPNRDFSVWTFPDYFSVAVYCNLNFACVAAFLAEVVFCVQLVIHYVVVNVL